MAKNKKKKEMKWVIIHCPCCRMSFEAKMDIHHPDFDKIGPCPFCETSEWQDTYFTFRK